MHFLSVLSLIFFTLCSTTLATVQYTQYSDGAYGWGGHRSFSRAPTPQQQAALVEAAYDRMVQDRAHYGLRERDMPPVMATSWWPDRYGSGGTLIFHSSTKGGPEDHNSGYINDCNIGNHRYRGKCAEINTLVYAQELQRNGQMDSNNRVTWSVFGQFDPNDRSRVGWIAPCSDQTGTRGCASYVDRFARQNGGGGQCIMKKEAKPAGPIRPKPDADAPDAPITPGTQNKDAPNTPNSPNKGDDTDAPTRLGQQPKKDDPDAPANKNKDDDTFGPGGVCSFPRPGKLNEMKDLPEPKMTRRGTQPFTPVRRYAFNVVPLDG